MLRFCLQMGLLWGVSCYCSGAEPDLQDLRLSVLLNPVESERILLIGFSDAHIDHIQVSAAPTIYRRRGPYSSSTWSRHVTSEIEEGYRLQKLSEWPITEVGMHCAIYRVPDGLSIEQTIDSLSQDERVELVQRMHLFKAEGHRYNDPYYRLQSNMHEMDIESAHKSATGKNVVIAVIDTGVDRRHPDLEGQIEQSENFVSAISAGFEDDIHGTAVTGVIAARKNNRAGIIGVAPDAKIIALKACWPAEPGSFEAVCNSFTLALAVNAAIRSGVEILNMSLAGPEDPLLATLLEKARQEGIVVVAADPGREKSGHRFPASMEGVIPVQTLGRDQDERAINAPGEHILTTLPYGTYDFVSGSSLAAAEVSGLIALMRELNPELSADQINEILHRSVEGVVDSKKPRVLSGLKASRVFESLCTEIGCPARQVH